MITPNYRNCVDPHMARGLTALMIVFAACASASGPQVLHSFGVRLNDGSDLYAGLVMDAAGNLYGAAAEGGTHNAGVVYRLSPGSNGWSETIFYNFRGGTQDGSGPHGTLVFDASGNLYGTTASGGLGSNICNGGCGVVFELTPSSSGPWTETILHRFSGPDGSVAYPGVVLDASGNLFGATTGGGAANLGLVYELAAGTWTQSILHSFTGKPDGNALYATPVLDAAGNVYGVTYYGGAQNRGTVFELSPDGNGTWTETILHNFRGGTDGANPMAALIFDQKGALYGTTIAGGTANYGTAFKLAKNSGGAWTEILLHAFLGVNAQDAGYPNGLVFDSVGDLYGSSSGGGQFNPGTIFELSRNSSGGWSESVLYSFTAGDDGAYPSSTLIIDPAGNLYGTTLWGGPSGDTTGGVAFKYTP